MSLAIELRTVAGAMKRRFFPAPERAALRALRLHSEQTSRRTPGHVQVLGLELDYVDALTLVPQWEDIFVKRALAFECASASPRILDCGANVGLASLWYKRAYPQARITAFEADPRIASTLARNLASNGCADVEVVNAAVWVEHTTLAFRAEGTDSGAVESVAGDAPGEVLQVPAVRLRDRLERERVDLLKLDIEGAEQAVLEDIAPLLRQQVGALQMEIHDLTPNRRILPRCLELLTANGFHWALDELVPVDWRPEGRPQGPFPRAIPAYVVLVRAWHAA
jgi:FkbM family methyltransferase